MPLKIGFKTGSARHYRSQRNFFGQWVMAPKFVGLWVCRFCDTRKYAGCASFGGLQKFENSKINADLVVTNAIGSSVSLFIFRDLDCVNADWWFANVPRSCPNHEGTTNMVWKLRSHGRTCQFLSVFHPIPPMFCPHLKN